MLPAELREQLPRLAATFQSDGVVCIPKALRQQDLALAQHAYEWNLANPTPSACTFYDSETTKFYQDLCHPAAAFTYRELIEGSPLADIVAALWQHDEVWFLYEQVFLKQGAATRRTPWHQDTPYLALDGEHLAVAWISFDPVDREHSLEFIRGSHRRTLYDGSAFDPDDDTKPIYAQGLPRLPDIEARREDWDIVSFAVIPGDVVIFHPSTLHGGAATQDNVQRRTLSLRFFGSDAVYAERPAPAPAPLTAGLHEALSPGEPFRFAAFPKLRPTPSGFDAIPIADGHSRALKQQISRS